jgi:hypothetical protein
MRALSRSKALEHLGSAGVGRVAYTRSCLPAVLPVRYRLEGEVIVFSSDHGDLGAELAGQVIALQGDGDIEVGGGSWTVCVVGVAGVAGVAGDGDGDVVPGGGTTRRAVGRLDLLPALVTGWAGLGAPAAA